jgi:hypothetical protein
MATADLGVMEMCCGLASFSPLIDLRRACWKKGIVVSKKAGPCAERGDAFATHLHLASGSDTRRLERERCVDAESVAI